MIGSTIFDQKPVFVPTPADHDDIASFVSQEPSFNSFESTIQELSDVAEGAQNLDEVAGDPDAVQGGNVPQISGASALEEARRADIEAIAQQEGLYSFEQFYQMVSGLLDVPAQIPTLAAMGGDQMPISEMERPFAGQAIAAVRRALIAIEITRPLMKAPSGLQGDLLLAGSFLFMKGRIAIAMFKAYRAKMEADAQPKPENKPTESHTEAPQSAKGGLGPLPTTDALNEPMAPPRAADMPQPIAERTSA